MENPLLAPQPFYKSRGAYIVLGVVAIVITAALIFFRDGNVNNYAWACTHKIIFRNAARAATANARVANRLGTTQPLSEMAILEGEVTRDKDSSFTATVTITGKNEKAKMDVKVHEDAKLWYYDYINIRFKNPDEIIPVSVPQPVPVNQVPQ